MNNSRQKGEDYLECVYILPYLRPGFLVYLHFYGQILIAVYKLNSLEAKKNATEISEELSQLFYHAHIFFLVHCIPAGGF